MSARGAADFLTRATTVLAITFVAMCIGLAAYASLRNPETRTIDTSLARQPAPTQQTVPTVPATPAPAQEGGVPLAQ